MRIVRSPASVGRCVAEWRRRGERIGLVPTMGALHDGHLALARAARRDSDRVVSSLFVNPAQFGQGEDLGRYPRTFATDRRLLAQERCDLLFAPTPEQVYAENFDTYVVPGKLAEMLEGATRPGHFRGVATVCLKLFMICKPHGAYFGQKDYQQTVVIRQMIRDLNLDLKLVIRPTVRDSDGLALSSRNRFLSPDERQVALNLPRVLKTQAGALRTGAAGPAEAERKGRAALRRIRALELDYFVVRNALTLAPPDPATRDLVLLAAVRLGRTRLIDNLRVRLKSARS